MQKQDQRRLVAPPTLLKPTTGRDPDEDVGSDEVLLWLRPVKPIKGSRKWAKNTTAKSMSSVAAATEAKTARIHPNDESKRSQPPNVPLLMALETFRGP